ncbi:DEAD/DEAH box helicase [Pseudoalteromonas sp. A757]|uniref:DEAD/DEAH box helicase n=1 Tax=Pseudoalteromonas sp. A757 TaxID=2250709 RepID=UPI000FFE8B0D|nr:DEAD/DEAH box helicase [Pseudoalteromonas sp. A757]RXE87260.1 DNA helicase [Pseudoalteromonas sp. A757]
MPRLDAKRLEVARSVSDKLAKKGELTPFQARSFVRCLQTSWEVEVIKWREGESLKLLNHAYNLLHVADIFREVEGDNSLDSFRSYKRAAELLEWLARSGDEININVPVSLLAGAAYQLSGLPAMSSGLLRQVTSEGAGWSLYAHFLQGDFDGVIGSVSTFWKSSSELTQRGATSNLLSENEEDAFSWYISVELVRTIGLISHSLRVNDKLRLNVGLKKLDAMRRMGNRALGSDISLLISMLCEVAVNFSKATIYNSVERLSEISPKKSDTLKRLARAQYHNGRGILWASQLAGVERLIEQSSFALCTPTGSGKTLVANLALIKELLLVDSDPSMGPLAIYLVPSRALASEVERKLTREMGSEFVITGLYGGNDWGITDYWLEAERPTVLIATVEKAEALMRYLGPLIVARLKLLILDEAHQVVPDDPEYTMKKFAKHEDRSLRLESFVSRVLVQAPEIARLALTAVAGGAAAPVSRWIELDKEAQPVGLNYRSTRQLVGVFETRAGSAPKINIDLMNGAPLVVAGRNNSPYLNIRIDPMPQLPAAMRNSLNRYNQLEILWTSMHFRQSGKRVLISLTQAPQRTMKWYCEALVLPEWTNLVKLMLPEDPILQRDYNEALDTCLDYCGEDSYEATLLRVGIATSHGQMPQRLRLLMTNLIEHGICSITIATATLTEGVNLPFDIIFLPQLRRQSYDRNEKETIILPLSTSEFRNLSGRAGRPGAAKSMEGLTLIAIPQAPSTTAKSMKSTQQKQVRQFQSDYEYLIERLEEDEDLERVNSPLSLLMNSIYTKALEHGLVKDHEDFLVWLERSSPGDVSDTAAMGDESSLAVLADTLDELDGVLLSAAEEFSVGHESFESSDIEECLKALWGKTFSTYAVLQENWMERAFIKRGIAIVEEVYSDEDERKRLYQYGFTPFMGRRFDTVFNDIKEILIDSEEYGTLAADDRFDLFEKLAEIIRYEQGFGFSVGQSDAAREVLENWSDVLKWWINIPDSATPEPDELREWQRFVSENLEFKLGVAVGASVARAWSDGVGGELVVPSLEDWKETTELPWFAFWVRELLRWGTHEPFVAFSLAQGVAKTRSEAFEMKVDFDEWLENNYYDIEPEDRIDPKLFLNWRKGLVERKIRRKKMPKYPAEITGSDGSSGEYNVLPLYKGDVVIWLDPAGYELARSNVDDWGDQYGLQSFDFKMTVTEGSAIVKRIF